MTSNLFLIPVGKSPVHSYRLLHAVDHHHESIVILVVSELTGDSGNRIKKISHDIFTEIQVVNYTELKEKLSQLSIETKPNIISGPGTREINLVIWHDVISTFSKLPNIWVDHGRRSKQGLGKLTDEHYLYNLSNRNEKYALNSVSMKTPYKDFKNKLIKRRKAYKLFLDFFKSNLSYQELELLENMVEGVNYYENENLAGLPSTKTNFKWKIRMISTINPFFYKIRTTFYNLLTGW